MSKTKIAYFGYDFFYHCLIDTINNDAFEVIKLFSFEVDNKYNFNTEVIKIAKQFNIPVQLDRCTKSDIQGLNQLGCKYIVVAGYQYRIPIQYFKGIGINLHPSLLPSYRGPRPLPHIILNDEKESGVTLHEMTPKFDEGDILVQKEFKLESDENLETLSIKSQIIARKCLIDFLKDPSYYLQNKTKQGVGTYNPRPTLEMMTLNREDPVDTIDRVARSYGKMCSYCVIEGIAYDVEGISIWKDDHNHNPGKLIHKTNKELLVAAKDGFVCLRFYDIEG